MLISELSRKRQAKGEEITDDDIKSGIVETLKYAVKPADIMGDGSPASHEWFYELTRQTHKLRFVATGGALKNILKDDDLTDEKMVNTGENDNDEKTDEKRLNFTYYKSKKATFTIQNLMSERGQGVRPLSGHKSTAIPLGSGGRCVNTYNHSPIPKMK